MKIWKKLVSSVPGSMPESKTGKKTSMSTMNGLEGDRASLSRGRFSQTKEYYVAGPWHKACVAMETIAHASIQRTLRSSTLL